MGSRSERRNKNTQNLKNEWAEISQPLLETSKEKIKDREYVRNHNTLFCSVWNNTTRRFKPGHLWCWSGEVR